VLRLAAEKAGWGKSLPAGHAMGIACGRDHRSYAAEVVELAKAGSGVRIVRIVCAVDCGPVMNPTGARAQVEGGIVMALSAATKEAITIAGGGVEQDSLARYPLLRITEAPPSIETHFVETDAHPTGLGEPSVPPLAPALANALAKLTGKRPRGMPFSLTAT
jgi:isoquinoline 1-oxidoreductase beta subunit